MVACVFVVVAVVLLLLANSGAAAAGMDTSDNRVVPIDTKP